MEESVEMKYLLFWLTIEYDLSASLIDFYEKDVKIYPLLLEIRGLKILIYLN